MNIRIYVEGGGDGGNTRAAVRQGFSEFFKPLRDIARNRRKRFDVIACGGRDSAYEDFRTALQNHTDSFNILLVDAEDAVKGDPKSHLHQRENWDLRNCIDEQCHLMVRTMEAWLIADRAVLSQFYGQGFHENSLPNRSDVEQIDKAILNHGLKNATRGTQKGEYHKIQHGPKILARVDVARVRAAAPHCDGLFQVVERVLNS